MVKHNGTYYLFFAAGKFCQSSYSEGVARAPSIWGERDPSLFSELWRDTCFDRPQRW